MARYGQAFKDKAVAKLLPPESAAPEFNSTQDSDHLLATGAVGWRVLILVDIETLMTGPEMGLVAYSRQ